MVATLTDSASGTGDSLELSIPPGSSKRGTKYREFGNKQTDNPEYSPCLVLSAASVLDYNKFLRS